MKIAFACSTFPPIGGGAERQMLRVLAELVRRGHEAVVVTRHVPGSPSTETIHGVQVLRVAPPTTRWPRPPVLGVIGALRRERPDVVIASQAGSALGAAVIAAARPAGPRVVLRLTGGDQFGAELVHKARLRSSRLRTALLLRRSDAIVSPARHILEHVGPFAPLLGDRCVVIPNGAPEPLAITPDPGDTDGAVVWVGRPEPVKGYDAFVELTSRFPALRFVAIGPDPARSDPPNLLALGWRPEAASAIARARALVITSRYEGTPNTMVEALANGVPVVAFDLAGTREVADFVHHGVWLVPRSMDELAAALQLALDDPRGVAGRIPTVGDAADAWESLLQAVMAGEPPTDGPWITRQKVGPRSTR